ncbi:hypothetical protein [Marisediminicola sp. LYQ134]|uniref:hypothetical protein n=1 Tax=Marisediminicola sp. LYQ134 TaxID=3391061 RepID=UPI003982F75B
MTGGEGVGGGADDRSITVSGGGVVSVATADLYRLAHSLDRVAAEAEAGIRSLDRIEASVTATQLEAADAIGVLAGAESGVAEGRAILVTIAARAAALARALRASAEIYGATDDLVDGLARGLTSRLGAGVGLLASTVGVLLLPGVVSALAAGGGLAGALTALAPEQALAVGEATRRWVGERKTLLSDPALVTLVRHAVMGVDDTLLGVARVPGVVTELLGDDGLGLVGLATSASLLIAAGGAVGALRETEVRVRRAAPPGSSGPSTTTPSNAALSVPPPTSVPTGIADRAARVPSGSAQVRIDRIDESTGPRFEVFVAGTVDPSLEATEEPWDMTSNVTAIAGGDAASVRAVERAMALAGVDAQTPVVMTGYSQGGLIAATVAASGDYDVRGVVTLGAPAGQVAVPGEIPWVALEHTDDLVPAAGGTWATDDAVVVRRRAVGEDEEATAYALPAHRFDEYERTARLTDAAGESRVEAALAAMNAGPPSGEAHPPRVTSTWFEAERVPRDETLTRVG